MEGANALKVQQAYVNLSSQTARRAPQMFYLECMRLPNPNLIHNHSEVATKNWALSRTDGGHHRNQNRRTIARNRLNELLAIGEWCTG
jgi:hypothetical protein